LSFSNAGALAVVLGEHFPAQMQTEYYSRPSYSASPFDQEGALVNYGAVESGRSQDFAFSSAFQLRGSMSVRGIVQYPGKLTAVAAKIWQATRTMYLSCMMFGVGVWIYVSRRDGVYIL